MTKLVSAKAPPPKIGELEDLIPRLMLFPGEDSIAYEDLRDALLGDLAPGAPYERALAENLVTLEWEAIRHRRMRDTLIKAKARDLAVGVFSTGEVREPYHHNETHERLGSALVSADRKSADLETRRRRLRDDYERLKAARARPVEDAEIIG